MKKDTPSVIAQSEQEKRILSLIDPVAEGLDMEIVRVRVMGGRQPLLQIMAEKSGGLPTDVEHCKRLSKAMSVVLDDVDPITERYTLEVSTPGIDRPLTRVGDFGRWTGHAAKLELIRPLDDRRRFRGVITGEENGKVTLQLDDETELEAEIAELAKASLILTDQLIEAARTAGTLPPQDDDLEDFEIDEQTSPSDEDDLQET
ncbi:MAG: ribosome maturation factor RimP [Hyphomonadaceae bacterium]